ncbi:MAG: hypothetical protein U0269_13015 [Polyangiales bacterium]
MRSPARSSCSSRRRRGLGAHFVRDIPGDSEHREARAALVPDHARGHPRRKRPSVPVHVPDRPRVRADRAQRLDVVSHVRRALLGRVADAQVLADELCGPPSVHARPRGVHEDELALHVGERDAFRRLLDRRAHQLELARLALARGAVARDAKQRRLPVPPREVEPNLDLDLRSVAPSPPALERHRRGALLRDEPQEHVQRQLAAVPVADGEHGELIGRVADRRGEARVAGDQPSARVEHVDEIARLVEEQPVTVGLLQHLLVVLARDLLAHEHRAQPLDERVLRDHPHERARAAHHADVVHLARGHQREHLRERRALGHERERRPEVCLQRRVSKLHALVGLGDHANDVALGHHPHRTPILLGQDEGRGVPQHQVERLAHGRARLHAGDLSIHHHAQITGVLMTTRAVVERSVALAECRRMSRSVMIPCGRRSLTTTTHDRRARESLVAIEPSDSSSEAVSTSVVMMSPSVSSRGASVRVAFMCIGS